MMAELSTEDREKINKGLMKYWSAVWELTEVSVQDLQAAVNAADAWIDSNQVSYNQALPLAARDNLTQAQKTLVFCAVAMGRVSMAFLRRVFGGAS